MFNILAPQGTHLPQAQQRASIAGMTEFIDLSHSFYEEMSVYPGDIVPRLCNRDQVPPHINAYYSLKTGMHAGTHVDAPLHMLAGGLSIDQLPLESFSGRGRLVDARGKAEVLPDLLQDCEVLSGDIVLVMTK